MAATEPLPDAAEPSARPQQVSPTSPERSTLDDPEDLIHAPSERTVPGAGPSEAGELDEFLPPRPPERSIIKRVTFLVIGTVLILIGVILWATPIIGGAPLFLIPGLILLAKASDPIRRLINHSDRKLPNWARKAMRWARDKTGNKPGAGAADGKNDETAPPA